MQRGYECLLSPYKNDKEKIFIGGGGEVILFRGQNVVPALNMAYNLPWTNEKLVYIYDAIA